MAGVVIGGLILVGVLAWAFKKRGSPRSREFRLVKVGQGKPHVLKNLERRRVKRDSEGNLQEVIIIREVKSFE